jgi:hypothetical protein
MESLNEANTTRDGDESRTTTPEGTTSASEPTPAEPMTQKFDDGSELTTNPDGTMSAQNAPPQNGREAVNDAVTRENNNELLTPAERASLEQVKGTYEMKGGDVRASVYTETKTPDGPLQITNRTDVSVSKSEGVTANNTTSGAATANIRAGAGTITAEAGREVKVTTHTDGKITTSSSNYAQAGIERNVGVGTGYAQAKVSSSGNPELNAGVRSPGFKTGTGTTTFGAEVGVTLPRGNSHEREMATQLLERDDYNRGQAAKGFPLNMGKVPFRPI